MKKTIKQIIIPALMLVFAFAGSMVFSLFQLNLPLTAFAADSDENVQLSRRLEKNQSITVPISGLIITEIPIPTDENLETKIIFTINNYKIIYSIQKTEGVTAYYCSVCVDDDPNPYWSEWIFSNITDDFIVKQVTAPMPFKSLRFSGKSTYYNCTYDTTLEGTDTVDYITISRGEEIFNNPLITFMPEVYYEVIYYYQGTLLESIRLLPSEIIPDYMLSEPVSLPYVLHWKSDCELNIGDAITRHVVLSATYVLEYLITFQTVDGEIIAQVFTDFNYFPSELIPNAPLINKRPFLRWTNLQGHSLDEVITSDLTFLPLYGFDLDYIIGEPSDTSNFEQTNYKTNNQIPALIFCAVVLGVCVFAILYKKKNKKGNSK